MTPAEIRTWKLSAVKALRVETGRKKRATLAGVVALWEIAEQLAVHNSFYEKPRRDRKKK